MSVVVMPIETAKMLPLVHIMCNILLRCYHLCICVIFISLIATFVPSVRMKVKLQMLYGGHFVLAVKKFFKGARVAPGGVEFRTCPSNIINNKTLAGPQHMLHT